MKRKLGLIQIFRGFAAMVVVFCHLSGSTQHYFKMSFLGDFFFKGYIGVDFFFVLSGFIITYVHFKDIVNRSNKITFLKKRFIRIYPIYWIIASVDLFLLFLAHGKTDHLDHVMNFHAIAEWRFIAGCYLLIQMNYGFFLPTAWSLAYEIIFYIVFFIFILIGLKRAKYIFVTWVLLILSKIVLSQFYALPDIMILNERIIEFLTGCGVGYVVLKAYFINTGVWGFLLFLGLIPLYFIFPNMLKEPLGVLVLAYLMGLIVYKIVSIDMLKENNYSKLLLLIGDASYSIYLSHLIFLAALYRIFKLLFIDKFHIDNFIMLNFLVMALFSLTIAGGILIYKFIETPLIRFFNKKLL